MQDPGMRGFVYEPFPRLSDNSVVFAKQYDVSCVSFFEFADELQCVVDTGVDLFRFEVDEFRRNTVEYTLELETIVQHLGCVMSLGHIIERTRRTQDIAVRVFRPARVYLDPTDGAAFRDVAHFVPAEVLFPVDEWTE